MPTFPLDPAALEHLGGVLAAQFGRLHKPLHCPLLVQLGILLLGQLQVVLPQLGGASATGAARWEIIRLGC